MSGGQKEHWKKCRAESITAESQPVVPDPSETADATDPSGIADAPGPSRVADASDQRSAKPLSEAVVGETYEGTVVRQVNLAQ